MHGLTALHKISRANARSVLRRKRFIGYETSALLGRDVNAGGALCTVETPSSDMAADARGGKPPSFRVC